MATGDTVAEDRAVLRAAAPRGMGRRPPAARPVVVRMAGTRDLRRRGNAGSAQRRLVRTDRDHDPPDAGRARTPAQFAASFGTADGARAGGSARGVGGRGGGSRGWMVRPRVSAGPGARG